MMDKISQLEKTNHKNYEENSRLFFETINELFDYGWGDLDRKGGRKTTLLP